jgi:long-chain acyl-CoA synthetase
VLVELLEARDPRAPVLIQNQRAVTAGELAARARALAAALAARGISEGDRVAVVLPNCREFLLVLAACARIGAVAAPLDPASTTPELERALAPLAPRAAFILGRGARAFEQAAAALDLPPALVLRIDRETEPGQPESHALLLDDILDARLAAPERPPERAAFLAHETHRGRGTPHYALLEARPALEGALAAARATGLEGATRGGGAVLAAAPFHRASALAAQLLAPLALGAPIVVLKQLRARMALLLARAHDVRAVVAPPVLLALMARFLEASGERPLERVSAWIATAAPPPPATLVALCEQTFGAPLVWGYGSAECPWALVVPPSLRTAPPDARGLGEPISPRTSVHLVAQGVEVAPGEPGAVHVRAPWAARELLGGTAEDAPVPLGIPTGDRAVRDPDGRLRLLPREDVGTVAAFEVDLAEVAATLREHPAVALASAHAVPDPDSGAHVLAVVALAPGAHASVAELIDFLRPRLSYYKLPQAFRFRRLERPA